MRFLINRFNHSASGRASLDDPAMVIAHQLVALGHQVAFSDDKWLIADDAYNILFEAFAPSTTAFLKQEHERGARFLIVATEEPTDNGFNHGLMLEMIDRQREFPNAAKLCDGILSLVPGAERWYSQYAPAVHIELGYAPTLYKELPIEPDHAFAFFGSTSERRLNILKTLARKSCKAKAVNVIGHFPPQAERDIAVSHGRVVVQIRNHDKMGLLSNSRCVTALRLGRPVIAEPHEHGGYWDKIIRFAPSLNAFYDEAVMMQAAWRSHWRRQFDAFKSIMTPEYCIGEPLARIGITPPLAQAA